MNHGKKAAVLTAFDIHLECAEGNIIDPLWKLDKRACFHRFREKLELQMLQCKPAKHACLRDEKLRSVIRVPKKRCRSAPSSASTCSSATASILQDQSDRFSGVLSKLHNHIASVWTHPSSLARSVDRRLQRCGLCRKAMHCTATPEGSSVPCFCHCHASGFAGLAQEDCEAMNGPLRDWRMANQQTVKGTELGCPAATTTHPSWLAAKTATSSEPREGFGLLQCSSGATMVVQPVNELIVGVI